VLIGIWLISYFIAKTLSKENSDINKGIAINGYEALMQEVNGWSSESETQEPPKLFDFHPNKMDLLMGYVLKFFTPTCLILAFAQNTKTLSADFTANTLEVEIYG
jgi:hypothetical protein